MSFSARGSIELEVAQARRAVSLVSGDLRNLGKTAETGFKSLNQTIIANERHFNELGRTLTVAGAAVTGVFTLGLKTTADFEVGMNRVQALSAATAEEFEALRKQALALAESTRYTALEVADAMGFLAMAGFDVNEIMAALPGTLNLAAAAQMDLSRAADLSTNILTAFGMEASELDLIVDQLVMTFTNSNTSMEQLGDAFRYVGPVAQAAGLDFAEVAAMLGMLGDAGIQGSLAGTTLRGAITRLINPTGAVKKNLDALGVSITDANGQMLPMVDILRQFPPVTAEGAQAMMQLRAQAEAIGYDFEAAEAAGLSWEQQLAELQAAGIDTSGVMGELGADAETVGMIMEIFGLRAGPGMVALLTQGTDKLEEFTDEIANSGGVAERVAKTQLRGLTGSINLLRAAWQSFMIRAMSSGPIQVITGVVRVITRMINAISMLPDPLLGALAMLTGVTGAALTMSGVFLLLLPRIANTVEALRTLRQMDGVSVVITRMTTAVRGLSTAMLGLFTNPVFLAGALAIGALFLAYRTNFMGFADAVDHARERLGSFTDALDILLGKPPKKQFDIVTTADNVWDQWQLQPDGSFKHAELGITSKPDDGAFEYLGYDETTDKWTVMHISSVGEIPGEIVGSSQNPDNPDMFYWEIQMEGGEQVKAIYDQSTGLIHILEEPTEFVVDTSKAFKDMTALEKIAAALRAVIFLLNERFKELDAVLRGLADKFAPVINFAKMAWQYLNPLHGIITKVTGTFRTLNNILLGDWGAISWEDIMDAAGLSAVYDLVVALRDGYKSLKERYDEWINREPDTTPRDEWLYPIDPVERPDDELTADPVMFTGRRDLRGMATEILGVIGPAREFAGAMAGLDVESAKSAASLGALASTIPPFTSATQDADQATGAMAGSMGGSFSAVALSALKNFAGMRGTALRESQAMQLGSITAARVMQSGVGTSLSAMRAATALQMNLMKSSGITSVSDMSTTVGLRMSAMQLLAGLKMREMASGAKASGADMDSGLTSWLPGASTRISLQLLAIGLKIRGFGSTGYDAGYYAGSMISQGFAAGMSAYLNQIRAAGNAMVAEASRAVIARAMISSPSRLFESYGKYIGEGLELGILRSIPDVGRAADRLLDTGMPSPAFNTPVRGGGGGVQVIHHHHDNSQYFTVTTEEMAEIKRRANRGDQAYSHLSDPDAFKYGAGI